MSKQSSITRLQGLQRRLDTAIEYLGAWSMADLQKELKVSRQACIDCYASLDGEEADGTLDGLTAEEWRLQTEVITAVLVARSEHVFTGADLTLVETA